MNEYVPELSHQEAIPKVRDRIVDQIDPQEIWLFGSAAREEAERHSDLDLLVVVDYPEGEQHQMNVAIRRAISDLRIPKDILSITPDRFEQDRDQIGTLAEIVVHEGTQIYAREDAGAEVV